MRLGRGGDVDRVRPGLAEHPGGVREDEGDVKALGELAGHQLVRVARGDDLAARQVPELGGVLIGDVPAPDDRHARLLHLTPLSDI